MKKRVLAAFVVLFVSSTTYASVILDYVENGSPGPGLKSYTVRATGVGIVTLSKFTIDGNVYQEFLDPATQSPWIADGTADPFNTGRDSYIIFGNLRMPDLAGHEGGPGNGNPIATSETILDGSAAGLGTLNNFNADQYTWDAYLKLGVPPNILETRELFHLVLAEGTGADIALDLYTATDYNPVNGSATITKYELGLTIVPEPGCVMMLLAAFLCLAGYIKARA